MNIDEELKMEQYKQTHYPTLFQSKIIKTVEIKFVRRFEYEIKTWQA